MEPSRDSLSAWFERYPTLKILFDPKSTDAEFDEALERRIFEAIQSLEADAKDLEADKANENRLSATLAGRIEMPGLRVIREGNSNGHVDITINVDCTLMTRSRLAEAKLHKGPKYHIEGLEQLLNRYITGRESTGYMLDYVQATDIKKKIEDIETEMDKSMPCKQMGKVTKTTAKWAFQSTHNHRSGEDIRIVHFGVNLCWK